MTRNPYRTAMYALTLAGVYAVMIANEVARDYGRSVILACVLCALVAVRDDLTKAGAP